MKGIGGVKGGKASRGADLNKSPFPLFFHSLRAPHLERYTEKKCLKYYR